MEICGNFRLQKGTSLRLRRGNSLLLESEHMSLDYARFATYERLSDSTRLTGECCHGRNEEKKRNLGFLGKVFSFRRVPVDLQMKKRPGPASIEENKGKKKASWLPDPDRRWPLQGWG